MDLQKASTLLKTIKKAVENKHLKSAFEGINQLNSEQHNYQINQRLEELETISICSIILRKVITILSKN